MMRLLRSNPRLPATSEWHLLTGRARQLCPGNSDVDPLCNVKGIVDLDTELAHGALDAPVAEQKSALRLGFPFADR
jgi:hypothetical protein